MINALNEISNKKKARIAGLLYLVVVLTGVFSLAYVPSKLIVWNNAATTVDQIIKSEFLFRLGIMSSLICYIFFLLLPLALYKLLKPVEESWAKLMVALSVVSVPISFVNILNKFAVLSLIKQPNQLNSLASEDLQNQVMFYLNQYDNGILIAQLFWGLWLFPFGYLIYRSGFLPKILGVLLMAGCFGYLINFTGNFLIPNYGEMGIARFVSLPASFGEIGTCLWLLIMGAKDNQRFSS